MNVSRLGLKIKMTSLYGAWLHINERKESKVKRKKGCLKKKKKKTSILMVDIEEKERNHQSPKSLVILRQLVPYS